MYLNIYINMKCVMIGIEQFIYKRESIYKNVTYDVYILTIIVIIMKQLGLHLQRCKCMCFNGVLIYVKMAYAYVKRSKRGRIMALMCLV